MAKARTDGKPIVYIGFGSITVPDPKLVTERIIRGVLKSEWRSWELNGQLSANPALRWCACDYLQRMVGPNVERWERRRRDPRRMLFGTSAALASCVACHSTDVRCSWTKCHTSGFHCLSFPRNCVSIAYPFDLVVGSSHRSTRRCTMAGPELPEPAYGVRRASYKMVHMLKSHDSWYPNPYPSLVRVSRGNAVCLSTGTNVYRRDQFFWASRVQKLGVRKKVAMICKTLMSCVTQAGIKLNSLHSKEVAQALKKATTNR